MSSRSEAPLGLIAVLVLVALAVCLSVILCFIYSVARERRRREHLLAWREAREIGIHTAIPLDTLDEAHKRSIILHQLDRSLSVSASADVTGPRPVDPALSVRSLEPDVDDPISLYYFHNGRGGHEQGTEREEGRQRYPHRTRHQTLTTTSQFDDADEVLISEGVLPVTSNAPYQLRQQGGVGQTPTPVPPVPLPQLEDMLPKPTLLRATASIAPLRRVVALAESTTVSHSDDQMAPLPTTSSLVAVFGESSSGSFSHARDSSAHPITPSNPRGSASALPSSRLPSPTALYTAAGMQSEVQAPAFGSVGDEPRADARAHVTAQESHVATLADLFDLHPRERTLHAPQRRLWRHYLSRFAVDGEVRENPPPSPVIYGPHEYPYTVAEAAVEVVVDRGVHTETGVAAHRDVSW